MMTKMRRMSHGRSRDFPERKGIREYAQQANSWRIGTVKKWRWSLQTRESVDVQQVFDIFNEKRQTRYTRAEKRRAVSMIRAPPKG